MPPGELGGAVPSLVSATHPAPSIRVPLTIGETVWHSRFKSPTHGTRYPDDQWAGPSLSLHAVSDVHAVQPRCRSQPHLNPNNIGVEQQQRTPHNYTEKIDSRDDFPNANPRPMSSGSPDEMSDNEWTRTLSLNGTRVPVRALMAEAVGDLKLSDLPGELGIKLAAGPKLSILAIEVWIRENKAPMVRLSYVDGTDNCDFEQLVEEIRAHGVSLPSHFLPSLATSRF
ncbi:hypothetical protein F5888DRAFT_1233936 [Russula emetica]|nr:hypothetical protein F5888DRAFT_1233936 [Russula emetica]